MDTGINMTYDLNEKNRIYNFVKRRHKRKIGLHFGLWRIAFDGTEEEEIEELQVKQITALPDHKNYAFYPDDPQSVYISYHFDNKASSFATGHITTDRSYTIRTKDGVFVTTDGNNVGLKESRTYFHPEYGSVQQSTIGRFECFSNSWLGNALLLFAILILAINFGSTINTRRNTLEVPLHHPI
jgi:hypothetical protein